MKFVDILSLDRKTASYAVFTISVAIVVVDLVTPTQILLSIFFVIPVLIAAWYNSLKLALALSLALPLTRFVIAVFVEGNFGLLYSGLNAVDRIVVLSIISIVTRKLSESIDRLKVEVKVLEGLIPICSNCKKIRDKNNEWQPLEKYIGEHSEAAFTHGICPDCAELLYGEYLKKS